MLVLAALVPNAISLREFMQSIVYWANPVMVDLICLTVVALVTLGFSF
jgi:hypothetical protein